uniref:GDP-mannose 4,6-dehydratase n=2 Tax=Candidatus Methanogaster sp. ANME-2c ERB4 TaxID=2759911 RepID=A0A7G9Y183_9EURY|nr:GDP-mannose 4,6-dehydratase [Methanosarcinales archaeon ANME-2c ERB4]
MRMMTEKHLVTGATGFTGYNLVKRLVKEGNEVSVLVRKTINTEKLKKLGVNLILGDIRDKNLINSAVRDIDIVYHLAAAWRDVGVPDKVFWDVNVNGTRNLLEASLRANVERFIHCSTGGVLGHIANPPANETFPYNPGDIYQKTKCEGEKLAVEYFHKKGLAGVVVRPTGIYGPGDLRFLKLFKTIYDGKFIMVGKGDVLYHLVYIDDLIDGYVLCGQKGTAIGQTYIIGGDGYVSLNELVSLIAKTLDVPVPKKRFPFFWPVWMAAFACEIACKPFGISPPIFRRRVDIFRKNRAFDISKARKEIGYTPKVGLGEGLKKTAEWYKEEGYIGQ